jgi:acetyl-CoA carboxylase biotin carboxyl carrier protein
LTRRLHHENLSTPQVLQPVDLKEIRTLIDLMKKNGLSVFKMEREGFKITLKTSGAESVTPIIAMSPAHAAAANSPKLANQTHEGPALEASHLKEIKSPMVGTFYASPSPEAPPYVTVGQEITPDSVVCIIEAMKVMNEIKAEISGIVAEVCAENGKPVQFGQTLFRVK